jgi:hypothetical protein
MISSKILFRLLCLILFVAATAAQSQVLTHGGVAPLTKIPSEQWIEKVVGDMDKPGQPFVIRIHHDAGCVVLPHTHPEDENIRVLTGSWALGMGSRVNMAQLEPMEQGALGFVPKKMAHFGYARRLLRAKDRMDAASHEDWPVRRLARVSRVSEAHFARSLHW